MNYNNRQQQQQIVRLPDPADMTGMVVRGVSGFARRNKVLTASYLFGMVVLLFFAGWMGGMPLSLQQKREFHRIMSSVDQQAEFDASQQYWQARNAYYASKGWFFSCDGLCQRNKERMRRAEQQLTAIRREGEARMSDAKKVAGIFSEVAVDEAKESFWQYFSSGKQFAKRQSMWDAMFIGLRSMRRGRDESMIEFGLKVLLQVLFNFSMGLIMALVMFVVGLYSIVRSYQPNPIMAVVFFVGAATAAFSFVATYLMAVYGAAGASVYGVLKLAETSARARLAEQQREGAIRDRPHYD